MSGCGGGHDYRVTDISFTPDQWHERYECRRCGHIGSSHKHRSFGGGYPAVDLFKLLGIEEPEGE